MMKRFLALGLTLCLLMAGVPAFAETELNMDWLTPFEDTVTLTTVLSERADAKFPAGDDMTSNIWTRAFKDRLNVEVVTEWVSSEYETKMNLAIASQTLPDVFTVNNAQFQQLKEAGLLLDITDAYESAASDRIKSFMDVESEIFETAKQDGRLYGIPQLHYGSVTQPNYIWLRKDWMEEMGAKAPETMDELEALLLQMMERYGSYGLAVDQSLDYLEMLAPAWHAYPEIWLTGEDGSIVYGSVQPEMKAALAEWADWYQKGIISVDFATMDYQAMSQDVINGKVGAQPFAQWWGYGYGPDVMRNNNLNAYFEPYNIPSTDDKPVYYSIKFPNGAYTVISKNCKNPEAAIKLIDLFIYITEDSVGVGDMTKEEVMPYMSDGILHVTGPFRLTDPINEYNMHLAITKAIETGDESLLTTSIAEEKYHMVREWYDNANPDGIGYALQMCAERCSYGLAGEIMAEDRFVRSAIWGPTPEELVNYGSTLDDLLVEGFTKIVMGVEPIDYFDTLVEQWSTAGGAQATAAVNAMYGK